jgi:hypothetical protein
MHLAALSFFYGDFAALSDPYRYVKQLIHVSGAVQTYPSSVA